MWAYLVQGLGWGVYAGILPGPTQAFILSKTLANGWKRSLPLALVPLVSDLPIAMASCFLAAALPDVFLNFIKIAGGIYLVYLGWSTWRMASSGEKSLPGDHPKKGFWKTVLINVSNPNVYLFWGTIGAPVVLQGWSKSPANGISFILGMYAALILVVCATIVLFGFTGKLPDSSKSWLFRIFSVAIVLYGLFQTMTFVVNFVGS
jgi:threonine/homoserine/homoserine lactone efflux protein